MMNEVVAEHPEWTLKQVMEDAGNRTMTLLGIKKGAAAPEGGPGKKRNPALPDKGTGSRKANADTRSSIQKEIDELVDF